MNAINLTTKSILPNFVVREEGTHGVFLYLTIPKLKLKRSFINFFKFVPSNGSVKVLDFRDKSFTFAIHVQTKLYSISIAPLPGEIQPEHCSIKYRRGGCRITLIKLDPKPWMSKIYGNLHYQTVTHDCGLSSLPATFSPVILSKETDMLCSSSLVSFAPHPSSQRSKKRPAPPPPPVPRRSLICRVNSSRGEGPTKKGDGAVPSTK